MVVPHVAVSALVPVTPLVTLWSWRLLEAPGVCTTPVEFALVEFFAVPGLFWLGLWLSPIPVEFTASGLLWYMSLAQYCPCGVQPFQVCTSPGQWLSPAPVGFTHSGLLWPRLLAQTCFCKCPWSGSAPAEVPGCGLVLQRSLVLIYSHGGPRPMCTSTYRGPDSGLLPWRSQTNAQTHRGPGSGLVPGRSQTHTWISRGPGSGILSWSSEIHAQTCRGLSGPVPLIQWLLLYTCSSGFAVSGLLQPRLLTSHALHKLILN